jgi:hypothetical protein
MALTSGGRLGAYEILAALGAGGMGEVYRARDTKLNRDVALKILPESFVHDPDRVARFRREAQVLASLNHPHIATIHGVEEADGHQFLILELVEGETLTQRLKAGPLPLDEALPIAKQIAEALEAAHEKGIIHRDLKPANIAFTGDGQVKVLDFGLAKALDPPMGSNADLTNSPTITSPAMMTGVGVLLGTASYMSPEQARGKTVDKRADIWAFGCVLYEMLTGRPAFARETVSDTIAAILEREPDWAALPATTPKPTRKMLRRCLEKDRKQRLADIADARLEIQEAQGALAGSDATEQPTVIPRRRFAVTVALAAAVVGAVVAALTTWVLTRSVPAKLQLMRFAIVLPASQALATQERDIAISPDGTRLVYRAGVPPHLVVRAIDSLDATPLARTTDARFPFMLPDGQWVGFFAQGTLRKASIRGGAVVTVCKIMGAPRGASWGDDETIVFATSDPTTGLLSVPDGGGEPTVVTKLDAGQSGHWYPSMLPGGKRVLFTISSGAVTFTAGSRVES